MVRQPEREEPIVRSIFGRKTTQEPQRVAQTEQPLQPPEKPFVEKDNLEKGLEEDYFNDRLSVDGEDLRVVEVEVNLSLINQKINSLNQKITQILVILNEAMRK